MALRIAVEESSATPPFEQVREQIVAAVRSGALLPGERLPAIRSLAAEVGIAANTAARAYRELEAAGVLVTRGRAGTCVAEHPQLPEEGLPQAALDFARETLAAAREAEIDDADLLPALREALADADRG